MSVFNVELKKVVDDSYDIEMGYRLEDQLVEDLDPAVKSAYVPIMTSTTATKNKTRAVIGSSIDKAIV